jgi:hypothetical protein
MRMLIPQQERLQSEISLYIPKSWSFSVKIDIWTLGLVEYRLMIADWTYPELLDQPMETLAREWADPSHVKFLGESNAKTGICVFNLSVGCKE